MGKVIVVTSGKGGVGKTTSVANLGAGLAQKGRRVVMVDADVGLRNLDVVLGLEHRILYDLADLAEGKCSIEQALIRDVRFADLYLIAASQVCDKTAISPEQMLTLTKALCAQFDYVLIDCPAGIEQGFKTAVCGASEAIVVVTPEFASVRDADRVVGLLINSGMPEECIRLIINRVRPKMVEKGNMLSPQEVADILSVGVLGVVQDDEYVIMSTNRGETAVLKRRSAAGRAYKNICERLEGARVPLLCTKRSVAAKLFGLNATPRKGQRKESGI